MPGKVFISCGQRPPKETEIATEIAKLLNSKFSLEPYLAFKVQSFDDVMEIAQHLATCDYYLFIDFKRLPEKPDSFIFSLFTHQELALAYQMGFQKIIALQEEGCPLPPQGFAKYILSNPEIFSTKEDLLQKIEMLVKERMWSRHYSRHLIVELISLIAYPIFYNDHTGKRDDYIYHCAIANKRNDKAAINTIALLKHIEYPNGEIRTPDSSFLKWAGIVGGYSITILPETNATFDLLSISKNSPNEVYLHSALDTVPRNPIINRIGDYILKFNVFAEGFPLLEFRIKLFLTGNIQTTKIALENLELGKFIEIA